MSITLLTADDQPLMRFALRMCLAAEPDFELVGEAAAEEIVHAIRVIANGEALLAPKITRRLLDRFAHRLPSAALECQDILNRLTRRELEVLELVARGYSNSEIGSALHLADSSVKTHVSHVLTKLGMADRVQLVILAYETGLVQLGTM